MAILDFGGHVTLLETGRSSSGTWDESIEIYFADGTLKISIPPALLRNVPAKVEVYKQGSIFQRYTKTLESSWSFRRQAEAFVEDVIEKKESLINGIDSVEDIHIVETMWKMKMKE